MSNARAPGHGDMPPRGCRRWRGSAAKGGGPLLRRRSARFARARRSRQGEEGTGFSERRAQRRRAAAVADEIEQVAMFRGCRVGPFSRYAGAGEADEQRAPLGAVAVAGDPVSPLFAALRQITAAHLFGATRRALLRCRPRSWGGSSGEGAPGGARNMISKHRGTSLAVDDRDALVPAIPPALAGAGRRGGSREARASGRPVRVGSGATAKKSGRRARPLSARRFPGRPFGASTISSGLRQAAACSGRRTWLHFARLWTRLLAPAVERDQK